MTRVVVQINAGLGNQLFQYACGCAIANHCNTRLRLDLSSYASKGERDYKLEPLKIADASLNYCERALLRLSFGRTLHRVGQTLPAFLRSKLYSRICDSQTGYDARVFACKTPIYLSGYWQSPRYFETVAEEIRSRVCDAAQAAVADQDLLNEIRSSEAICVHVRRGDLITNKRYASEIHVQPSSYYNAAQKVLSDRAGGRRYFVFSDDPAWPRQNLELKGDVTYVCEKGPRDEWEDLGLMSACKHFIIANSTFSWWAAWLGNHTEKMVCAPRLWRCNNPGPPTDLLPKEWIII